MKAFAFVLLCALAAVQGRYTALQSTRTAAALGENPWLVHLRIAVSYSGLLETGVGSLISERWVLTTADNVFNARFIWVRYAAVNVINPELVTEVNSPALLHPHTQYNAATGENNIALVSINRYVEARANIAPISPVGTVAESARFCSYGEQDGVPGEVLNCYEVAMAQEDDSLVVSSDEAKAAACDKGAPLVSDGAQVGLLVEVEDSVFKFLATAEYKKWIEDVTGLDLNGDAAPEDPEEVRFVQ